MSQQRVFPAARIDDLVTKEVGTDLVVHDQKTHQLHQLNQVSATVWRSSDGLTSLNELAANTGFSAETVGLAVKQLGAAGLLTSPVPDARTIRSASRRSLMKKAAAVGAIPAIVSVSAPMAAMATTMFPEPPTDVVCGSTGPTCSITSEQAYQCCTEICGERGFYAWGYGCPAGGTPLFTPIASCSCNM